MVVNQAGRRRYDARHLALLSILTALCYIGRIVFQFIPNVQPVTAILIILTLQMGILDGLIVATLSLILTNMMMGMGPWTFAQLISFAVIIFLTGIVMRPLYRKKTVWLFVVFAFLSGIFYGLVISLIDFYVYGMSNFFVYYAAGWAFDLAHAAGNAGFYLLLEPILRPLFKRFFN